jgi:hypothetical protein
LGVSTRRSSLVPLRRNRPPESASERVATPECPLYRLKPGPEIGPRLHLTQPNSLDINRSIGPDSAL